MSESSSSTFVNRHGRRMDATETIAQPEKPTKPNVKRPKKTIPNLLSRLPGYKRRRLAVIGALIMLGLVTSFLIIIDSSKRSYDRQSAVITRSVLELGKRSPSSNEKPSETSRGLASALSAPVTCPGSGIDVSGWYQPARVAKQTCQMTAVNYAKLKTQLIMMSSYASYIESLTSSLRTPTAPPSETQYAIPQNYQQLWQETTAKAKSMTPPEGMKQIHLKVMAQISEVSEAWNALASAHNNQQSSSFISAEKKLQTAYINLKTIATPAYTEINKLQADINKTIASLNVE